MPTMKIRVWETEPGRWCADPVNLPGQPPNGTGRSKYEAVGNLVYAVMLARNDGSKWTGWPEIGLCLTTANADCAASRRYVSDDSTCPKTGTVAPKPTEVRLDVLNQ